MHPLVWLEVCFANPVNPDYHYNIWLTPIKLQKIYTVKDMMDLINGQTCKTNRKLYIWQHNKERV